MINLFLITIAIFLPQVHKAFLNIMQTYSNPTPHPWKHSLVPQAGTLPCRPNFLQWPVDIHLNKLLTVFPGAYLSLSPSPTLAWSFTSKVGLLCLAAWRFYQAHPWCHCTRFKPSMSQPLPWLIFHPKGRIGTPCHPEGSIKHIHGDTIQDSSHLIYQPLTWLIFHPKGRIVMPAAWKASLSTSMVASYKIETLKYPNLSLDWSSIPKVGFLC